MWFKEAALIHFPALSNLGEKDGLDFYEAKCLKDCREKMCVMMAGMEVLLTSFLPDLFRDVARHRPVQQLPVNFWGDTNTQPG